MIPSAVPMPRRPRLLRSPMPNSSFWQPVTAPARPPRSGSSNSATSYGEPPHGICDVGRKMALDRAWTYSHRHVSANSTDSQASVAHLTSVVPAVDRRVVHRSERLWAQESCPVVRQDAHTQSRDLTWHVAQHRPGGSVTRKRRSRSCPDARGAASRSLAKNRPRWTSSEAESGCTCTVATSVPSAET